MGYFSSMPIFRLVLIEFSRTTPRRDTRIEKLEKQRKFSIIFYVK